MDDRYSCAIARIDDYNREDPNGKELVYGERMSACLDRFSPDAAEPLRLAARAQHIGRWRIPRKEYPMDRRGYKAWRTQLAELHAETTGAILTECGYDEETVARVQFLLKKKALKTDADTQTLEDVICLVFLEYYFAEFAAPHEDEKVIQILQRTWVKMSDAGHEAALRLPLAGRELDLVKRALA